MKKTITMLLLTALCMTVFASCDLGNGLVAELWGDIKDAGADVDYYPTDDYIAIETDIVIDIPPSVEDIMTTPPYEIVTEDYTGPYTTGEDWTYDCIEPVPDADAFFVINTIVSSYPGSEETMTSTSDIFSEGFELHLRHDTVSVSFGGWAVLYGETGGIGYRIGKNDLYHDSFWVELPEDAVFDENDVEGKGVMITVPADRLEDGYNEITLVYSHYGYVTEIGTIVVFKELPTTAGEDTVDAVVEETVEEATTEIEFPEIDIDD